jgi:hypothetical protein
MNTTVSLINGSPMKSMTHMLSELELALVTVQDIIGRLSDEGEPGQDYIAVNLGLYVLHVQTVIIALRQFDKAEQADILVT